MPLDWWFRSQSLYFSEPQSEDPDTIIVFKPIELVTQYPESAIVRTLTKGNIEALILDNKTHWFNTQKVY